MVFILRYFLVLLANCSNIFNKEAIAGKINEKYSVCSACAVIFNEIER